MDHQLLSTLLRRLLDLCRRLARRSLQCLFRVYSALLKRKTSLGSTKGDGEVEDAQRKFGCTCCMGSNHEEHCQTSGQSVTLAYSSTPRKPPPARSYTRHTSIESYGIGQTCASPTTTSTLEESPTAVSHSSCSGSNQRNLPSASPQPVERYIAELAPAIAPPKKPIKPVLPSLSSRYDRNIAIRNDQGPWVFGPLETVTVYDELAVPSWTHYVQPEGQLYFHNTSRRFNYLTEAHLCDPRMLAEAELFISVFERKAESFKGLPVNLEVVFEINDEHWLYYMVDLERKCLLWLDDYEIPDEVLPGKFGVEHREHFRHMFDFEFWQHVEYFPTHRPLQEGLLEELMGLLVQMHIDVVTSLTSTSPYNDGELRSMIGSVKQLQALQTTKSARPYVVQGSAKIMGLIANERYYNFFGFHGARLSCDQSVRGNAMKSRSLLITLLSPALFYAPEVHLLGLEKVWMDGLVKVRHWKSFQSKLERDWEGFVLYATVLLNANVAFLGIPSVMSDNLGSKLLVSPAAIISQVSIIASLGSIIIGLLLVRQMRIGAKESVEDYLAFLENRTHEQKGLETLAILFSLPYALLMWGMATFLAAVAIICFYNFNGSASFLSRIIYGVIWLFISLFILWTIVTGWEKRHNVNWRSLIPSWCYSRFRFHQSEGKDGGAGKVGDEESGTGTGETELELEDVIDVRSVRSKRSVRSRFTTTSTIASSINKTWRSRVRRLAGRHSRSLPLMDVRVTPASQQAASYLETEAVAHP
ncbi:uncharacterized protein FOMMEDRAFT_148782 [Fomitiporia mediterranea MF3/22]|uniref:uncharacterized protein n=1 Tax=Fomitiporia mediterranea (strain MF3/22) TaxID=694068 RepID=UPI0004409C94|nr:uncharacterized protein FOMMEDRAFT_148782 [Fomitiporia mediterranea MF3/22]EJC99259.1 hypothetical protein FOMMEDRAFT_148782 [Fomitiporia mediterranea MF3/22]